MFVGRVQVYSNFEEVLTLFLWSEGGHHGQFFVVDRLVVAMLCDRLISTRN